MREPEMRRRIVFAYDFVETVAPPNRRDLAEADGRSPTAGTRPFIAGFHPAKPIANQDISGAGANSELPGHAKEPPVICTGLPMFKPNPEDPAGWGGRSLRLIINF